MKKKLNITPSVFGCDRQSLSLPALSAESVQINGMTVRQQLSVCVRLAEVINFYDTEGKLNGFWDDLISRDVTMLSATLLEKDLSKYSDDFSFYRDALIYKSHNSLKELFLQQFFNSVFSVITEINSWYILTKNDFNQNDIFQLLTEEISDKGKHLLKEFYGIYFSYCENHPAFKNLGLSMFNGLDIVWDFDPFPYVSESQLGRIKSVISVASLGRETAESIFTFLHQILGKIELIYEESLLRKDIRPQIGLFIAFLDLLEIPKKAINNLSEKHLNFYYRSVLMLKNEQAKTDKCYLSLTLNKGIKNTVLPQGSSFQAGTDADNKPITFSSVKPVAAISAKLKSYRTFYFNNVNTLSVNGAGAFSEEKIVFDKIGLKPWNLLGSLDEKPKKIGLGFSVSSSDLFLKEGKRSIYLKLKLKEESVSLLSQQFSKGLLISELLSDLNFKCTSLKDWLSIDQKSATLDKHNLNIQLELGSEMPPVSAYDEKIHGKGYSTTWPLINAEGGEKYYKLFSQLNFTEVTISTKVDTYTKLLLENDQGKVAASSVFMPFGSVPVKGSNWSIGIYELFVKKIETVELNFKWVDLPETGFSDYYVNYTKDDPSLFESAAFKYDLEVLNDGDWCPVNGFFGISMFVDNDSTDKLKENVSFNIAGYLLPNNRNLQPFDSLKAAKDLGFLRLKISNPSAGFGNELYPGAISRTTLDNGLLLIQNKKKKPEDVVFEKIPNKPYIPKAAELKLSYQSENTYKVSAVSFDAFQFYNIGYEGIEMSDPGGDSLRMMPLYEESSYAYFGFEELEKKQSVSLLISVVGSGTETISNNYNQIQYEYLSQSGWMPLNISSDTTAGFQSTGIVTWLSPADFDLNSQIDAGLSWIRIGNSQEKQITVVFIGLNGVEVKRDMVSVSEVSTIKKGTISKLMVPDENIKVIKQPVNSTGGKSMESENEFRLRTAYRLSHKNRMATISDVEQILMLEMTDLFWIKAIPMSYFDHSQPNTIKVVASCYQETDAVDMYKPITTPDTLRAILKKINQLAVPEKDFQVSNAVFRTLQVTCHFTVNQDENAYGDAKLLNEELKMFLSPWIKGNELGIKGVVNYEELFNFINNRSYVGQIAQLSFTIENTVGKSEEKVLVVGEELGKENTSIALMPWELIVSADSHLIQVETADGEVNNKATNRIGELIITN